ncbi:MAG: formylglycine-generating enzyme family protein [Spirochaetaceae bacterium]|nr:formylglycine-generating enzyme family protein [Spirochaetaceae bacterium]
MKKLNLSLLIILVSISIIGFVGCKDPEPAHEHEFSDSWSKDGTYHWHAATCEHTTEVKGKAKHSFGNWTTTTEATEEAEGSKERTCTVCGHKVTEVIAKLEHTHKFAEEWSKDKNNHWHASTCGHDVIEGKEEHSFGDWIIRKEATKDVEGSKYRICAVCNEEEVVDFAKIPKDFVLVNGTTITGTESWTPSSNVFVSGRSLTIPNLLVSDHEVTRGEYKAMMGSDPSTVAAYDKNGNKLTGDAVLNNPVNYVSWYDALVYCNKLSMQGNLTPCYSIDGSTDPDDWGEVPTSNNSTWNKATCDFEADGYRLPTEAEWEWLARGGENYTYAGSDTINDVAWYTSNTNDTGTREVKTKAPNGYGLYDMSGNAYEWCWDWYGSISDSSAADGAASGISRVLRGGSWYYYDNRCQVALRDGNGPSGRLKYFGFRVVRSAN